jgi:hypothetical protein
MYSIVSYVCFSCCYSQSFPTFPTFTTIPTYLHDLSDGNKRWEMNVTIIYHTREIYERKTVHSTIILHTKLLHNLS